MNVFAGKTKHTFPGYSYTMQYMETKVQKEMTDFDLNFSLVRQVGEQSRKTPCTPLSFSSIEVG